MVRAILFSTLRAVRLTQWEGLEGLQESAMPSGRRSFRRRPSTPPTRASRQISGWQQISKSSSFDPHTNSTSFAAAVEGIAFVTV